MADDKMVEVEERPYVFNERNCSTDPGAISKNMGIAVHTVGDPVDKKVLASVADPLSEYSTRDRQTMTFRAGFSVSTEDAQKAEGDLRSGVLPAGKMLNLIHRGPCANLRVSYGEMTIYLGWNGMSAGASSWEFHLNEPGQVASEAELEAEIYATVEGAGPSAVMPETEGGAIHV